MTASTTLATILNWFMMLTLILIFGGAGLWCLITPDGYIGTMGVVIGPDTAQGNLGRPEIRALGGLYFLSGLIGLVGLVRTTYLPQAYGVFSYLLAGLLIARVFSFAAGNWHPFIVAYAVLEALFLAHTIYRLRQLT